MNTAYTPVTKYTSAVGAFIDSAAPVVTKAEYKDGKVKIYFNKPVSPAVATYKVDGGVPVPVITSIINKEVYNYEFTPNADQITVGNHVVTLYDVRDSLAAPNTAAVLSATYSVTADVTAPAVTSLTADGMYTFKVKFTEALNATNPTVVVKKGALTLSTVSTIVDVDDPTIYNVTITDASAINKVYATGETSVALAVTVKGYFDIIGNIGAEYNGNVTLTKDTTPPTVVNAGLNKAILTGNILQVVFNENLDGAYGTGGTVDNKIVVKKDGVIISSANTSTVVVDTNGKLRVVNIPLGVALAQGTYTVEFAAEAVQDVASVKNVALSTTVTYTSSSTVIGAVITNPAATTNVFNIAFAGGVDMSDSATTLANYTLDGAAFPAGTTIGFYGDKKAVRITLPGGTVVNNTTALLKISKDVVNKDGVRVLVSANPDVEITGSVNITDDVKPVLSEAKYYVNATTDTTSQFINVKFNENLGTVNNNAATIANLKVTINGVKQTVTAITDGTAGDKYVTLTLGTAVNVNQAATILVLPEDADNPTILITDVAGNKATANSTVNTSGTAINPAVAADAAAVAADAAALTFTYDGTTETPITLTSTGGNASTITWAETTDASTVGVISALPAPQTVTFTRSAVDNVDESYTLTATITKGASSTTKAFTVTVKEKLAPTVTTKLAAAQTFTATGTQTLVFSEELNTTSKAAVKTMVDAAFVAGGTATYTSAWGTGATANTLTMTFGGTMDALGTNDVTLSGLTVAPGFTVTDLAGNASLVLNAAALQL